MDVPLTPLLFLERAERLFAAREGVVAGTRRISYREFAGRSRRMARALRAAGVVPGDRVAWLGPNTHELLGAYYAVLGAGGILVPLNIRLAEVELRAIVEDCEPRVLVRHPDHEDPTGGGPGGPVTIVLGHDLETRMDAAGDGPPPVNPDAIDERATAEIFYTSGSTGVPKGVMLSHRGLYLHAVHNALTNGFTGDDVVIHTIPLFHVNGWGTAHFLTALGGVHVMLDRFDPATILRLIEEEGVTRLFAVPTMIRSILDHPDVARRDLSSLRQVSLGGAPAGPELLAEVEASLGCSCICGYGLSEASPTVTRSLDKPGEAPSAARRATTGLPILGVDARVLDDDDVEVPWDGRTHGEICVRSNHVMQGYWKQPAATAEALRGGWLRTGDVAVVDGDGYLTIVDRRKDLIVSGGENISSVEVEKAIAAHPDVVEVAVVAAPDDRWGETPKAYVALRSGSDLTAEGLRAFVRTRLAGYKVPGLVEFRDTLPKGGTGKIRKNELRDHARSAGADGPSTIDGTGEDDVRGEPG